MAHASGALDMIPSNSQVLRNKKDGVEEKTRGTFIEATLGSIPAQKILPKTVRGI